MLPVNDPKSNKRRQPRKRSTGSAASEMSCSSTSSGTRKRKHSKRPTDQTQDTTLTAAPEPLLMSGRNVDAEETGTDVSVNARVKSKRRLSFADDEHHKTTDFAVLTKECDPSKTHGERDPAVAASASPSFVEKASMAIGGSPSRTSVVQSGPEVLAQDHESCLPAQQPVISHVGAAPLSLQTQIKENADAFPQLASGQEKTESDATKAQRSESGAPLFDVGRTKPSVISSRKSAGLSVTMSAGVATDQDQSPRPSISRMSSIREDSNKSQRRLSMSSFVQVLNAMSNERSEQRTRKSSSIVFDSCGRRYSEAVLTVAGVQITKFRAILALSVVVVLVLAAVIALLWPRRRGAVPTQPICGTDDCFHHSYRLFAKLNRNLDPCEDFNAYVCSAWAPPEGYLEHSNSAMDDVRKSWFPAFSEMLRLGSKTIRVGLKPLAMYSSCMGDPSEYGSDVKIFWKMIKECRLTWPEEPQPGSQRALDVLTTLAFKWQLPLFFQVRAQRLKSTQKWRFHMYPGSLIPLMYQHHLTVKNSGGYDKYWATFYFILTGKYNESAVNKTVIATARAMEGIVFKQLLTAMRAPVGQPVLTPISQIESYTPSLSSAQWLRALRETELHPVVELKDQVLLGDAGFFLALSGVMRMFRDTQLLSLIAWSFVQLLSPAVDYRLLENRYEQGVTIYRPYFCERLVETVYRFLVVALNSASRFSRQERAFVSAGFDSLVSAAVDMVNASVWLDARSRQLAAEKLSYAHLHLWPPESFLDNDVLGRMYAAFPSVEDTFAQYWAKSMRSAAELNRPSPDIDVQSYAVNYALPYFLYDAASNSVKVAVGAVTAPLYYPSGTKAMFYGGLGFSMALALMVSLDSQGLRWHPDGTFGGSFLSNTSAKAFEMRDSCLAAAQRDPSGSASTNQSASERGISVFPEIPALEVAYMAYRRAVGGVSDNSPQGIPGGVSGDEVFFMTLCYMMCTLPGAVGPHTVDCNKAVRNSHAFARSFRCSPGSQMNPKKKCVFFA